MFEIIESNEFSKWLSRLKDRSAKEFITTRILRIKLGNFGDFKPVGEGVLEARIHYGAGYRLYFIQRGNVTIIMLGGGDKSSQVKDIQKAKELAKQWG